MRLKLISLLAAAALLAACSKDKTDTAATTTSTAGQQTQQTLPHNDTPPGPVAGSNEDLVANVGDRIFFAYNKSDLSADARATLERQAEFLKKYPQDKFQVEGHCDERGTREYNLALGERRANAVKKYLVALGIDAGRVSTISYGKERPAVPGSDEAAWAQNRRGVSVVTNNASQS